LTAANGNQSHARLLRKLLHKAQLADVFKLGQWQGLGRDRKRHDGRVGRIDLGVDRWRGKPARQQIVGGIDRGLNLLLGDIET